MGRGDRLLIRERCGTIIEQPAGAVGEAGGNRSPHPVHDLAGGKSKTVRSVRSELERSY